ncbi:MAG: hypothetical protein M3Q58_02865 [Bacteroidota bacterium]|nr:hypothetical protein [Bacteroidota bacterium]
MKSIINIALIVLLFFSPSAINSVYAQCKSKVIVKSAKPKLKPFKYSGAAVNAIVIDDKAKVIDLEFTAYAGQEYRLIFCLSDNISQEIKINVFDKRKNIKSRKLIFETTSKSENSLTFDPPKSGNYYIEYDIPINEKDTTQSTGCMVLMIGYQTKN